MPQNIRVAVMGGGEYLPRLIRSILDKNIIDAKNMFLSSKNAAAKEAAANDGVTWCDDNAAAIVKSEIVLVCAAKRDMDLEFAPVSQCTAKRIIVTVCDDPSVNLAYIDERVVNGTEMIAATLHKDENGRLSATYEIGKNVRLFLHQSCRDLVGAMCGE